MRRSPGAAPKSPYTGMAPHLSPAAVNFSFPQRTPDRFKAIRESPPWSGATNEPRPAPRRAEVLPAAARRAAQW